MIEMTRLEGEGGDLGCIRLNRPDQLNALDRKMTYAMLGVLEEWNKDPSIKAVYVDAAPSRAFCAGGDIRKLYEAGRLGDPHLVDFFADEYRLNHLIATYSKPYVVYTDGITMGGGVGISVHAGYRIATPRYVFAMPETAIGFFPDIGATWFLNQCDRNMGVYLGLTGARIDAWIAQRLGFVDAIAPEHSGNLIKEQLQTADPKPSDWVKKILHSNELSVSNDLEGWLALKNMADRCFGFENLEAIFEALAQEIAHQPLAQQALVALEVASPTSLCVTFEALKRARSFKDLRACLDLELSLVRHFLQGKDFYEGVRAMIIDKDKKPQWEYASIQDVPKEILARYFS